MQRATPLKDYFLRPVALAHARRLAAMSQELVESGLRPSWTAARIGWHIQHPESVVLGALRSEEIVGFAVMRYADDVAHLNLLAVDPHHRRRGVARALLEWLEETAFVAGTFVIGLEVRATNREALAFYSAGGYRELERVTGYYQGVETAIRMERDLRPLNPASE